MSSKTLCSLIVLSSYLSVGSALEQAGKGTLTETITDPQGAALQGVKVTVEPGDYSALTNSTGPLAEACAGRHATKTEECTNHATGLHKDDVHHVSEVPLYLGRESSSRGIGSRTLSLLWSITEGSRTAENRLTMKQELAVRQVTKRYNNGARISARMTTASADGNHHWTGVMVSPGRFVSEEFAFFEQEQEVTLPKSGERWQMLPPEVTDFARFCADVSLARI